MSAVSATLLAAFVGGASALAVVVIQRYFDNREQARHKRAVATALVFEIKSFYRWYYRQLRPLKDIDAQTCLPPTINAPTAQMFVVYQGNTDTLGSYEATVVQQVVEFYGFAEWLLSTIQEYTAALAREMQLRGAVVPNSAPRKLLASIQDIMLKTDTAAVNAGRTLAKVAGIDDPFAKIGD